MAMFKNTAKDTALLLHPNSAIMGLIITPMVDLAPELKKRIRNEALSTYHP
jgi:hypothetical protein